MSERPKVQLSKSCVGVEPTVGSNPTGSAIVMSRVIGIARIHRVWVRAIFSCCVPATRMRRSRLSDAVAAGSGVGAVYNSGRFDNCPAPRRRGGVLPRVFLSCEPAGGRRARSRQARPAVWGWPAGEGLDRLDRRQRLPAGGVSTGSTGGVSGRRVRSRQARPAVWGAGGSRSRQARPAAKGAGGWVSTGSTSGKGGRPAVWVAGG